MRLQSNSDDRPVLPKRVRATLAWMGRVLTYAFRWSVAVVLFPLTAYLTFRRSLTAASVTLLLTTITALNIIWGYPWVGMLGISVSGLIIGWVVNRWMRPWLSVSLKVPASAIAGQAFHLSARLTNRRRVPAIDVRIGWSCDRKRNDKAGQQRWVSSGSQYVALIRPSTSIEMSGTMSFMKRGLHSIPPLHIDSMFPFFLFRDHQSVPSDAQIAITPIPLRGDEDPAARMLLSSVGDWTKRLTMGSAIEYIGSREYQTGMPVRRWDFASWARLGKPIVREYHAPTVRTVTLVVDCAIAMEATKTLSKREKQTQAEQRDLTLERLYSLAATAVVDLMAAGIELQMYLTCEPTSIRNEKGFRRGRVMDNEPLMIRLAAAEYCSSDLSDERLREIYDATRGEPVLLLTARGLRSSGDRSTSVDPRDSADVRNQSELSKAPGNVTVIRIDMDHAHADHSVPNENSVSGIEATMTSDRHDWRVDPKAEIPHVPMSNSTATVEPLRGEGLSVSSEESYP
ncbi:DUF58 domain-containing protein [Stieleria varia]|uniref:Uncharacterized protein n=1 Tax=Stieleria varia TaxID=2528005 RepID=A0A5C6AQL6_9BACT|nr:DUF58 domain-containing protein [Stieleria varia]TWU02333.1 hypothetical protein Pla52n_33830 [Stieleria varia]